jgi:hypothetical protein
MLNQIKKQRQISKKPLKKEQLIINWYILLASYSAATTKHNYNDDFEQCNDEIFRKGIELKDHYRSLEFPKYKILVNSDFMNMKNEFILYCYLLKKINDKLLTGITEKDLFINIDFNEMVKVFDVDEYNNKDHNHVFKSYFRRLKSVVLDIQFKNGNGFMANLIGDTSYKGAGVKTNFKVSFSKDLLDFIRVSDKNFYFTLDELRKNNILGARKLSFYFQTITSKNGFATQVYNRSTLETILGHEIVYINDKDRSCHSTKRKLKKTSIKDIKTALNCLTESGEVSEFSFNGTKDQFTVILSKHIKVKKKDKEPNEKKKNFIEVNDDFESNDLSGSQLQYNKDCHDHSVNNEEEEVDDDLDLSDEALEDIPNQD